jgi:hypothetical protein
MAAVAPVVDHVKRAAIQEIASKFPFNIFNIVAIVAILVIGFYLYRKFNQKFARGAIRMPVMPSMMRPSGPETAPVEVEAVGREPQESIEEVEDQKED